VHPLTITLALAHNGKPLGFEIDNCV